MRNSATVSLVNARPAGFDWTVILQVAICVIPSTATIDFARPLLGARYLALVLLIMLGYYVAVRDRHRFFALFIGVSPVLVLMRGLFFYNSPIFFLGMGLMLWSSVAWEEVRFVLKDWTWTFFALLGLTYWLLSFLLTHSWVANLRSMELVCTTGAICLLSTKRSYLATAFIGMGISLSAYAIAMLPYGIRLGEGDLDNGQSLGNPILVGLPAAVLVILTLADRGRFFMLENHKYGRLLICLIMGEWLVLSGSRGSWLTTSVCLTIVFVLSKISRKALLTIVGVGVLATMVILTTGRGTTITSVFNKTLDSDRSLANRTSGRSAQWEAIPILFPLSPIWGFGPGSAKDVDYIYTHRHLLFHSLYLDVIVETGLMGFIPLMIILGVLIRRGILHFLRFGEVTPLLGVVAFMLIGLSVTAFDCVSGIFLGLAFMAREQRSRVVARQFVVRPVEENELALVR